MEWWNRLSLSVVSFIWFGILGTVESLLVYKKEDGSGVAFLVRRVGLCWIAVPVAPVLQFIPAFVFLGPVSNQFRCRAIPDDYERV